MGKVKSVILTVVFTVLIAVLCAMCVVPTFSWPWTINGTAKDFNSVLKVMTTDSYIGGGYFTTYYPEGVITASEYEDLSESDKADYTAHGSLYVNTDDVGESDDFKSNFDKTADVIAKRFEALQLDYLKIEVIDDYALRVEVPSSLSSVSSIFSSIAVDGELTLTHSSKTGPMLEGTVRKPLTDYFEEASASGSSTPYIKIDLTKEGREKIASITETVAANDDQALVFSVGETTLISLTCSSTIDESSLGISGYSDVYVARTVAAVLDSCIKDETVSFKMTNDEIASFDSVNGAKLPLWLYIGFGVASLLMLVYAAVRYKGMGVAHIYGYLSYLIIVVMCFGLIEQISLTFAGIFAAALGAVLFTISNFLVFNNVHKEFLSGKRLEASVKSAYKSALAGIIDVHLLFVLVSLFPFFIGIGEMAMLGACLLVSSITSAACSLLLTRLYFAMFMGCVKNQYAFCNVKKEEVFDDED